MHGRLLLALTLIASTTCWPQGRRPVPAGVRQADKAEQEFERNTVPPPQPQSPTTNFAKVGQDATELATLSNSIPSDIDQLSKGFLSKDLDQKLRRIEKLAKRLRSRVSDR